MPNKSHSNFDNNEKNDNYNEKGGSFRLMRIKQLIIDSLHRISKINITPASLEDIFDENASLMIQIPKELGEALSSQ